MKDISAFKDTYTLERELSSFFSKVYAWMVGGLLITALSAFFTVDSGFVEVFLSNTFLFFIIIIAELGLVWFLSARIETLSYPTAVTSFLVYSFLNGVTLSLILLVYTEESIQEVFLITAGMFAGLSAYGYFTKKSLSRWGSFLFMGLIGLIIALVVNMILASSALYFAISLIGVFIFAGLTAYDTQKLKVMYLEISGDNTATQKIAILGALSLYLDFINLFLMLLRLFGGRR